MLCTFYAARGDSFLFGFPILDQIGLFPQSYIGLMTRPRDPSVGDRLKDGASGLCSVSTIVEAAFSEVFFKLFETVLELYRPDALHLIHVKGTEARRVGYVSLLRSSASDPDPAH